MHCQVISNIPQPPQSLPVVWANVSNFNCLPDAELAKYNWFPFLQTVRPDYNPATQRISQRLEFDGVKVTGKWDVIALTPAEQMAYLTNLATQCEAALEDHFNMMAKRRGYFGYASIVSYCDDPEIQWATDCNEFKAWRRVTVKLSQQIQYQVLQGVIPPPSIPEFIAMLPPLWPDPNATPPATGGGNGGTGNGTLS